MTAYLKTRGAEKFKGRAEEARNWEGKGGGKTEKNRGFEDLQIEKNWGFLIILYQKFL